MDNGFLRRRRQTRKRTNGIFIMTGAYSSLLVLSVLLSELVLPVSTQFSASPLPPLTEDQKNKAIAALETSLLKLFGLSRRPKPNRDIVIPQYMIDLYRQQSNDNSDIPSVFTRGKGASPANTIRSFFHEDASKHGHDCHADNCAQIWFNVSSIPQDEQLTDAELRVYIERNNTHESNASKTIQHELQVFEIMKPVRKGMEAIARLVDVQNVIVQNSSWVTLDVHPAVLKWKNRPRLNYGLQVRLVPNKKHPSTSPLKHVRLRRAADLEDHTWGVQRPLLVTYTDDGNASRTKREANTNTKRKKKRRKCEKGSKGRKCRQKRKRRKEKKKKNPPGKRRKGHKDLCRRQPLYVDFNDVGWNDWIVAPHGYEAYYCNGTCPFPLGNNLNTTNHAIVQTLVNSVDERAAPTACCVPTSLGSISMLYLDEFDKVILKQYQEMVVEGCGCR